MPEPAQPSPHRRHRQPQHLCHPPMPRTRRLQRQRSTDHLDPITTAQQTVAADQHVRDSAHRAPRATSTMPQHDLATTQNPPPRPPPRTQTPRTIRTPQLASQQSAFDFQPIRSYNLQQCPRASGRTLPSPAKVRSGGFLRVQTMHCPTNPTTATKGCPTPPSPPSLSIQQPRVLNQHGVQHTSSLAAPTGFEPVPPP